MPKATIVIADGKENSRRALKDLLIQAGYLVQAEARNAPDLLRKARTILPDLVIMDSNLEGGSTPEVVGILESDELSNVLVLAGDSRPWQFDDIVHINKPYNEETLLSVIEVLLLYQNRFSTIKQEIGKLKENLNTRKSVEKAKGILMKKLGIDEAEAYRTMQKESMNRSMSMKDLARAIIMADDNDFIEKER